MGAASLLDGSESAPVVRVSGFGKSYKHTPAVQGVDLSVTRGEMYGLIGPDGAGKSTLMKAVAGVLTYDSGSVEVFDQQVDSEQSAESIKSRLGLMPQGLGLNLSADLSVEENIDYFAKVRLVPADELDERKDRFLRMTRLDKFRNRPMKNLSGGMKQKLGLICSLIHMPELIILDEPTTGVDPVSRRDFWSILSELTRGEGMTALISTAYMEEALRFGRVSLMHEGKFLASGSPDDLMKLIPGTMVELKCPDQIVALRILRQRYPQVEPRGEWVRVFSSSPDRENARSEVVSLLGSQLRPTQVRVGAPELEDVFIALLRQRSPEEREGHSSPDSAETYRLPAERVKSRAPICVSRVRR